ncbi:hypothetical protein KQI69_08185 [Eubacterium sp. MSJ-13]|uniref:hypothetical protein n=1 Tax=Eubacterium sp. MSJ-13 TaxID=2841513 RepID=UPI001C11140B|nr:hypothetical protein [Eubacterium sp. MSJ-13]MBU5479180.1 hypothetical protein [Eubacterium sp. MSJ-13]
MGMDEKVDEVLKQYELDIKTRRRVRGSVVIESGDKFYVVKPYLKDEARVLFEESVKEKLLENGYGFVDIALKNNSDKYISEDPCGGKWVIRRWFQAQDCDVKDERQVCVAAAHLADLHKFMRLESGSTVKFNTSKIDIVSLFEKHNNEMKRVNSYIKAKKQKNRMEISILNSFKEFYDQGAAALQYIKKCGIDRLCERTISENRIIHGSYNYHNLSFAGENIITSNFEKAAVGLQVTDLYDWLRKTMEKNGWNSEMGIAIVKEYMKGREIESGEIEVLYALLLYPEKYWKLVNFYYNGKKTWISEKNYEKLEKIRKQESDRQKFIAKIKDLIV